MKRPDLANGVIFAGIGVAFFVVAVTRLDLGTSWQMGPGYFPAALSVILILLGAVIAVRALVSPGEHQPAPPVPWRGVAIIGAAPIIFILTIEPLGFALSVALVSFVASYASTRMTFARAAATAVSLSLLCVVIFIHLLGLPLSHFGTVFGG